MIEYAHYFFSFIRPRYLDDFPRIVSVLISSWDFYFWLIFSIVIRFSLPDIALWLSIMRNPLKIRDPFYPSQSPYPGKPLVTVLIAGRNVVDTIAPTIRSVFSAVTKTLRSFLLMMDRLITPCTMHGHCGKIAESECLVPGFIMVRPVVLTLASTW